MDQNGPAGGGGLEAGELGRILAGERIISHYQPILSLRHRAVLGFEALSRAVDDAGRLLYPDRLFSSARREGRSVALDRLCREKAIRSFHLLEAGSQAGPPLLLFLNFDTALLDQGVAGSGFLRRQVAEHRLAPGQVVIEIVENLVDDLSALSRFIRDYRSQGFLIALDDMGAGYSNLDRITLIRPNILKIERSLIQNIDQDIYKQEILQTLVRLCHKTGALVLAEGVERPEECLCVLDHDVDLLQGYYFARPCLPEAFSFAELGQTASGTATRFREHRIRQINGISLQHRTFHGIIEAMQGRLADHRPEDFSEVLRSCIEELPLIEAVYVLDDAGVMLTDTLFRQRVPTPANPLFQEAQRGDDLSLKEYFYLVMFTGLQRYVTESYISWATGHLTKTISSTFPGPAGERYVLCVDVRAESPPPQ